MLPEKQIKRKILPLLGDMGAFGAISYYYYYTFSDSNAYVWMAVLFSILVATTFLGMILVKVYDKKGTVLVRTNKDGKINMLLQPAYLFALIPMAFMITASLLTGNTVVYSILGCGIIPAVFFILGIGNGMYDYAQTSKRQILYLGIVPIGFTFMLAYFPIHDDHFRDMTWIFGSIYLLYYLLVINRMKLEDLFVYSKNVNVENIKSLRKRNDFLIYLFFGLYLVIFFFRNVLSEIGDVMVSGLLAAATWIMKMFYKLYAKTEETEYTTEVAETDTAPVYDTGTVSPFLRTVLIVLISLLAAAILYFLVKKLIQLFKWLFEKINDTFTGGKAQKKEEKNEEFEDINEFVKTRPERKKRKPVYRYRYTLRELAGIAQYREKIRYLYGFALERLKLRNIEISVSDTPEEILDKVSAVEDSQELTDKVFNDFTDEYISVRYGDKDSEDIHSVDKKAEMVDKGIADIKVVQKG
ncbi:MAG: hypothetical protein WCY62_10160 [Clostridia bacterium]